MIMVIINNNDRLIIISNKLVINRIAEISNWRLELCRDACAKTMIKVGDYK